FVPSPCRPWQAAQASRRASMVSGARSVGRAYGPAVGQSISIASTIAKSCRPAPQRRARLGCSRLMTFYTLPTACFPLPFAERYSDRQFEAGSVVMRTLSDFGVPGERHGVPSVNDRLEPG